MVDYFHFCREKGQIFESHLHNITIRYLVLNIKHRFFSYQNLLIWRRKIHGGSFASPRKENQVKANYFRPFFSIHKVLVDSHMLNDNKSVFFNNLLFI